MPKLHKPTHIPKLCQRARKANARKIVFKKFPDPSKKYKTPRKTRQTMTRNLNSDDGLQRRADRTPAANSTYPKGGVSCSKDSLVVNQTLVFQINFCGKSPALRVAAKRYGQVKPNKYQAGLREPKG